jgi:hypothetical protein
MCSGTGRVRAGGGLRGGESRPSPERAAAARLTPFSPEGRPPRERALPRLQGCASRNLHSRRSRLVTPPTASDLEPASSERALSERQMAGKRFLTLDPSGSRWWRCQYRRRGWCSAGLLPTSWGELVAGSRRLDHASHEPASTEGERREHVLAGIAPNLGLRGGPVVRPLLGQTPDLGWHVVDIFRLSAFSSKSNADH